MGRERREQDLRSVMNSPWSAANGMQIIGCPARIASAVELEPQ